MVNAAIALLLGDPRSLFRDQHDQVVIRRALRARTGHPGTMSHQPPALIKATTPDPPAGPSAGQHTPQAHTTRGPRAKYVHPVDYAIQPYAGGVYDYWSGPYAKNRVVSWCYWSVSTWQGCVDGTFAITGYYTYSQIGLGWVVCGTGTGDGGPSGYVSSQQNLPGTKCGEVKEKDGGVKTNICTRPGDSGSPLFSEIDGMAYGILSNGTVGTGACPSGSSAGNERSWYSPIDKIMNHVRNQTMSLEGKDYRFALRTWP